MIAKIRTNQSQWGHTGRKVVENMANKREIAETIALQALGWLAGDQPALEGFMAASGTSPADLRARAADADFLGAVLDFILAEDARVAGFCDAAGLAYDAPMRARQALPGGETDHWT